MKIILTLLAIVIVPVMMALSEAKPTKPKAIASIESRPPVATSPFRDTIKIETIRTVVDTVFIKDTVIIEKIIKGPYMMYVTEFSENKISIELLKKKKKK